MEGSYPLNWPLAQKRTRHPEVWGVLGKGKTLEQSSRFLEDELRRLGARSAVLTSNLLLRNDGLPRSGQKTPDDPGVALYFKLEDRDHVLACDFFTKPARNVYALAKWIEAERAQLRYGVGTQEQAFRGYAALPEQTNGVANWRAELFGRHDIEPSPDDVRGMFRKRCLQEHPDYGGDATTFDRLKKAFDQAKEELGFA